MVLVVGAALLLWSKWGPYGGQIGEVSATGRWSEHEDLLRVGGVRPGDPPSWTAAVSFTSAYFAEVARALVAALVLSAAVQACLPREVTARWFGVRTGLRGALVGGGAWSCCARVSGCARRRRRPWSWRSVVSPPVVFSACCDGSVAWFIRAVVHLMFAGPLTSRGPAML